MTIMTAPAVAQLGKFRHKLEVSESEGLKGKLNEAGINMVDLMMWLVIATLLLAAALQGIGYYQRASWTYQARSDVASVRTYMEAQYTMNGNVYPTITSTTIPADLKLTNGNTTAAASDGKGGWNASVKSAALATASQPAFFNFSSTTQDNNPTAASAAVGVTLT